MPKHSTSLLYLISIGVARDIERGADTISLDWMKGSRARLRGCLLSTTRCRFPLNVARAYRKLGTAGEQEGSRG